MLCTIDLICLLLVWVLRFRPRWCFWRLLSNTWWQAPKTPSGSESEHLHCSCGFFYHLLDCEDLGGPRREFFELFLSQANEIITRNGELINDEEELIRVNCADRLYYVYGFVTGNYHVKKSNHVGEGGAHWASFYFFCHKAEVVHARIMKDHR